MEFCTSLIFISEWPLKMIFKKTTWIWGDTKLLDKVLIDLMFLFLSNILQPFLLSPTAMRSGDIAMPGVRRVSVGPCVSASVRSVSVRHTFL